jgi:hypothetical protein
MSVGLLKVTALPYLTLPYLTLPYLTLPYLTLPYLTLPYLTLPRRIGELTAWTPTPAHLHTCTPRSSAASPLHLPAGRRRDDLESSRKRREEGVGHGRHELLYSKKILCIHGEPS